MGEPSLTEVSETLTALQKIAEVRKGLYEITTVLSSGHRCSFSLTGSTAETDYVDKMDPRDQVG
jgi:hypothetical protein